MIQALLLLQGRPQITASELAAELEVSVPTARRDLEALAMSGIPIYPTRGRGGGWRLIAGARTDLTGLTEGEVTSLLIGLAQSGAAEPERVAAVRKLVQAMPAPFRAGAQRVADATVNDVSWGEKKDDRVRLSVETLQRAIAARAQVQFDYEGSGGSSAPTLVPLIVGSRGARWYLLGAPSTLGSETADHTRLRTYRVDRISDLQTLPLRGVAPDGFDRGAAWVRMVERVENLRGETRAEVLVNSWAVRALCDRFGAQAKILEVGADADNDVRVRVEVRAHRVDALAEQLAGWTSVAEVLAPAEVRQALHQLGQRLTAKYGEVREIR